MNTVPIEQCPSSNKCEAPLCPLDEGVNSAVWYADEEICHSLKYRQPWVRKQRRIVKQGVTVDAGYFNVAMLEAIGRVTPKIQGVTPDNVTIEGTIKVRGATSQKWLRKRKQR